MKKIITFFTIILLSGFLFSVVNSADSTSTFSTANTNMGKFANGLSFTSGFDTSMQGLITAVMLLVNTLFFIFMIYAGVLWLSSSGSEEKISKAKDIILWCVVGIAVTLSSYAITNFILSKVGVF